MQHLIIKCKCFNHINNKITKKKGIHLPHQYQKIPKREYYHPKNTKKYQNLENNTLKIPNHEKDTPKNTSKILKQ